MDIIKSLINTPEFSALLGGLKKGKAEICGLRGSAVPLLVSALRVSQEAPLLFLAGDIDRAWQVYYDLRVFLKDEENILFFPPVEVVEGVKMPSSPEVRLERINTLKKIIENGNRLVISTLESAGVEVPASSAFNEAMLRIDKGGEYRLTALVEKLVVNGYKMEAFVEKKGELSVRGGILDIYSVSESKPVRIEFDGDTVVSLRYFDLLTQSSIEEILSVTAAPADENISADGRLQDYLSSETIVFVESPAGGSSVPGGFKGKRLLLSSPSKSDNCLEFRMKDVPAFNSDVKLVAAELDRLSGKGYASHIYFNNEGEKHRLAEIFLDTKTAGVYNAEIGGLSGGFILETSKTAVLTDNEIFSRYASSSRRKRFSGAKEKDSYKDVMDLSAGEYVVHVNYGIGKFLGLNTLEIADLRRDFLTLEYENGDKLHVPVEDVGKVHKYVGFESAPQLSRLGTSAWERSKARAKEDVQKTAAELLELYAARETLDAHSFPPDSSWQREFEEEFIYDLTADQEKAVKQVKEDMQSGRPIDRLICGDVGFGKTEVAVRAAFKAAIDGKQVALLCPTTILAEQHYNTFTERMADYPVRIGMVSRFTPKTKQKEALANLKSGKLDIVIGTHRLISKDVVFKDLGLLIIDDEQKFGVAQKERIKHLKKDIYCLSLSATPIPRTLYLSLSGIREISNINTPPAGRVPIQTYIMAYNDKILRAAIMRELSRQGQVYYVFNEVRTIDRVAEKVKRLVPEARVAFAHGQMPSARLEKIMMDFYQRKYDVLVSTTIVESGLDLPSANTIIIENADEFGLSQLYQLRGRVGRRSLQAYAYLTYPPKKILAGDSRRRLDAIEECDELSMGFSIAMKDLEIRGAGSILGKHQHGQIARIGFELYCRLLRDEIGRMKGEPQTDEKQADIKLDLGVNAYLPDFYVTDSFLKLNIYRDLMNSVTPEEIEAVRKDLLDRFGPVPKEAEELLKAVDLRLLAKKLEVTSIERIGNNMIVRFRERKAIKIELNDAKDIIGKVKTVLTNEKC
ncbi:MAG: transcription-repair coupling factor [Candidatus Firestonebacteria bacterium]